MVAKTDFCARAHANGVPREKPYERKTEVMKNNIPSPTDGPDEIDRKVHNALTRLMESLQKDPLQQALEKRSKMVQQALLQGATIADILEYLKAEGIPCGRDRLRTLLLKLNLWPLPKGEDPKAAALAQ
jgi:hypothetical protein